MWWRRRFITGRSGNADADTGATARWCMRRLFTSYEFGEPHSGNERQWCNQSESPVCHLSGFGFGSRITEHR
jgi:hypothetical protein